MLKLHEKKKKKISQFLINKFLCFVQGDDYLLNEDGLAKPNNPNHWKGKNGLYCVGLLQRGFYGASTEAQNIANDINSIM